MADPKKPIGSILLKHQAISPTDLAAALKEQSPGDPPLLSRLVLSGQLQPTIALKALSEQSGCPGIDLEQVVIRTDDLKLVPRHMAERHCLIPVLVKGNRMFVAMADPRDDRVLQELEMVTGKKAFPYVSLKALLREIITEAYDTRDTGAGHFVGNKCSPETLRKAGVTDAPPMSQRNSRAPVDEAPSVQLERRLQPSSPTGRQVVVDDAMARAGGDKAGPTIEPPTMAHFDVAPEVAARSYPTSGPGGPTVLVADGDDDLRGHLTATLQSRGYRVFEADRGDTALQMVRENNPDVIVLEATLPQVMGFEVARQLKGSDRYRSIRILMTSSLYRGWRIAEDLKANYGIDGFLEKPFTSEDLVHGLENALRNQPEADERDTSAEAEPYLQAGVAAYKAGNTDEAMEQLRNGVLVDPLAYKVRFHLGLLYGKTGQLYDGIQELETALSIRPDFFPALKNLAVLYQNAGFRNKAIEMWERCLSAAPDDATRETIKRHLLAVL
jgi:DNA-binding response OmpR family regulator